MAEVATWSSTTYKHIK